VRVKCLAQEHNTMSPARARTRTARSGNERTDLWATAPPEVPEKHILLPTACELSVACVTSVPEQDKQNSGKAKFSHLGHAKCERESKKVEGGG